MTDKKTFGLFIRTKRMEKNYSQKELAELLFVTEGAVSKWERGVSYPDITLVADICRVLEISEHEFITASTDTAARKQKMEAKKFRTIRNAWLWVPTVSYGAALVICFICNLAASQRLSWFFVVMAALLCAYTFVPTVTLFFEEKKLLAFTVSTYLSLCLLMLTCGIYNRSLHWVPVACIGVLMGYLLLFLPKLLSRSGIKRFRYLVTFGGIWALTILMEWIIHIRNPFGLLRAIGMTCYGFAPLILSAAVCILNLDGFLKGAFCTAMGAAALYGANYVATILFGPSQTSFYLVDFSDWQRCANGNISLLCLVFLLALAVAFGVIGLCRRHKKGT